MKKVFMFAAFAAVSTAFIGCSSDEDLAQVPEVFVEEPAPAPKGTPFSVSAFAEGATRATRYNKNAWNGTEDVPWVSGFTLWGKQAGADDPWLDNLVFSRGTYDATTWTTSDNITWPGDVESTTDVDERTNDNTFYAITSGSASNAIGVTSWKPENGQFSYKLTTSEVAIPHIDPAVGTGVLLDEGEATYVVDTTATSMADLMVATKTLKEEEATSGILPLTFTHALSGLAIKLIFRNNASLDGRTAWDDAEGTYEEKIAAELTEYVDVKINYIKVYGLMTSATYSFASGWSAQTTEGCYYKSFTTPPTIKAESEATAAADANYVMLVNPGEWLVIPQTTDAWDGGVKDTDDAGYIADGKAYIVLGITDDQGNSDMEVFLPLATTFTAGTNKTLRIDLGTFRDLYTPDDVEAAKAAYYFAPAQGGGAAPAFIFEE